MLCNQWNFYITFSIFPFIWHFHNWVWYNLPQYKPINRNLSLYCNIDSNKTSIWLDDCFKIFFIAIIDVGGVNNIMEIRVLKYFLMIAREENITKADPLVP